MSESYELKQLSPQSVPAALEKAQRYRLLDEPQEAESICLDILVVDPNHEEARRTLILALSDQLDQHITCFDEGMQELARLNDSYSRAYYEGILCERRAKAHHRSGGYFAGAIAYDWFRRAMACFETAIAAPDRPAGNEDAFLRWNTCARVLMRHPELAPRREDSSETFLE